MKVGVITFHSAYNFGASLQTWALQKVLADLHLESWVINYHPEAIDRLYDPIKATGKIKRLLRRAVIKRKFPERLVRVQRYSRFIEENFRLLGDFSTYEELAAAELDLDAHIVGSDQVWNSTHIGGYNPAFFLEYVPDEKKKIAYAASIGKDYILPIYHAEMSRATQRFSSISVREKTARSVVEKLSGKDVPVVVDPTLLLDSKDYESIKVTPSKKQKYILVYMMEYSKEVITFANKLSRTLGMPIVQRASRKIFANEIDNCFTSTPGEFIGLVENAEYVLTNSFHGTIFSIIYKKRFLSMLHSSTGSRTSDLLYALGLDEHLLYSMSDFHNFSQFDIKDKAGLDETIARYRKESLLFLGKSLDVTQGVISGYINKEPMVACPTNITEHECYGCYVCAEKCPEEAISMKGNEDGFVYPTYEASKCTHCGLCEKVCIRNANQLVQYENSFPRVFAAYNRDEDIRLMSSSGAVFPELARHTIQDKGGVVAGVKFNTEMQAVVDIAETMDEVKEFYGSKYVKSDLEGILPRVKEHLRRGTQVLYSGLPCECAALRAYLKKDYGNLLICEILCHSAPSPKVLEKYVDYLSKKYKSKVVSMRFRDKSIGWVGHKAVLEIKFESGKKLSVNARRNNYMRNFQKDHISRLSCTKCAYTGRNRVGDITIADYWGVKDVLPDMFDDKGVSAVFVNNAKAAVLWEQVRGAFVAKSSTLKDAFRKNHKRPVPHKTERDEFFRQFSSKHIDKLLQKYNDLK